MSIVRKSIDLDFLAGELRKLGKVLSRCESCGRLFTDVQSAILHRKVHSSVTILLPRASAKNKQETHENDKDAGPTTAVSPAAVDDDGNAQDGVQCDYQFIMEAIANANETMTFADLEKISSKMLQKKPNSSSTEFVSTDKRSSEKDRDTNFPYLDTQSSNIITLGSQGQLNKPPSTSSLEKDSHTRSLNVNTIGSRRLPNPPNSSFSEKDPHTCFQYVDTQSRNVNTMGSKGLVNPPSTSQANVHASAGHRYESLDRTCNTLHSTFSSCKTTGSKDTTNCTYNNGVKVSTDNLAVESDHEVTLQNQPNTDGHGVPDREYFASCESSGILADLDFGSAIFVGEDPGPQSFVSERRHHQLVQQLMGGSSFLQLLNEPLDESFHALYSTPCCNSNNNSLSIGSPYVEHCKPNTSLVTQSDSCVSTNLPVTSTRSNAVSLVDGSSINNNVSLTSNPQTRPKLHQRTAESVDGSKYVCSFRNNLPIRSQPTIDSKVDHITTTLCEVSNPTTDLKVNLISTISRNVLNDTHDVRNSKSHTKYTSSVQLKNHSRVASSQDPNSFCDLSKMESAENVTTKENETANDDDDIQVLECVINKTTSTSTDKKITNSRDASLLKEHPPKTVISVSLLPCSHCSLKCQTFLQLVDHMTTYHKMVISKCSKCGQIFYDADAVKKHLLIHKPIVPLGPRNSTKRFGRFIQKCQVCGLEFGNLQMFKNHMLSHPYPFIFSPESLSNPLDEKMNVEKLGAIDCDLLSDSTDASNTKEHTIVCESLTDNTNMSNKEDGKNKTERTKRKRRKSKMVLHKDEDSLDAVVIFDDEDEDGVKRRLRSSKKNKAVIETRFI